MSLFTPSLPPTRPSPAGLACQYAHSPAEMRFEAAVLQGLLPPRYKTSLCGAWAAHGM